MTSSHRALRSKDTLGSSLCAINYGHIHWKSYTVNHNLSLMNSLILPQSGV